MGVFRLWNAMPDEKVYFNSNLAFKRGKNYLSCIEDIYF